MFEELNGLNLFCVTLQVTKPRLAAFSIVKHPIFSMVAAPGIPFKY